MTTGLKLSAFLLALAAVFGLGYGLGALADPVGASVEPAPGRDGGPGEVRDHPHGD